MPLPFRGTALKRVRLILLVLFLVCLSAVVAGAASKTIVKLVATDRLPDAHARVAVEYGNASPILSVELDEMKPALLFGGDYATYVFWVLSPGGEARNAGEIVLNGKHAQLQVSAGLQKFGMLVTAEPHFLAATPSRFVIFQNADDKDFPAVQYESNAIPYNYERDTLRDARSSDSQVSTDVHQALAAFRLLQRVNAEEVFPAGFEITRRLLDNTLRLAREMAAPEEIRASARETVRLAADAERFVHQERVAREAAVSVRAKGGVNQ